MPKLPSEINILKVKRKGKNDSSKEYRVRRYTVQNALLWLKNNNPAYSDITISNDRLNQLPIDSSVNLQTLEVDSFEQSSRENDTCPVSNKLILVLSMVFESGVLISEQSVDSQSEVQYI